MLYKVTVKATIGAVGVDKEEAIQKIDQYIKRGLGKEFFYDVVECEEVKPKKNEKEREN